MRRAEKVMAVSIFSGALVLLSLSAGVQPVEATQQVQCGSGVQNRCGEKCVDTNWYGGCIEWHDIYDRTGN